MQYIMDHQAAFALLGLLLASEILPFSDKVKSNGIFQLCLSFLKKKAQPKAEELSK